MRSWCVLVTLVVQVRVVSVLTAVSSNSIDDSSGSDIFTALSFSLASADELAPGVRPRS